MKSIRISLCEMLLLCSASHPILAANLVTNGSFEFSNFKSSSEFSLAYNDANGNTANDVTGWTATGSGAYNIYFVAPNASAPTTISAANQWSSSLEKLWALPNLSQDGGNFVMLDGDTSFNAPITQMISTLTAGQTYTLSFDWAAAQLQSKTGDTTEQVQFSLGSDVYKTAVVSNPSKSFTGQSNGQWFQVSQTFTATASSELLSFLAIGTPSGLPPVILLDGVSLTQNPPPGGVPEPATFGMVAAALGAALLYTKFRRL